MDSCQDADATRAVIMCGTEIDNVWCLFRWCWWSVFNLVFTFTGFNTECSPQDFRYHSTRDGIEKEKIKHFWAFWDDIILQISNVNFLVYSGQWFFFFQIKFADCHWIFLTVPMTKCVEWVKQHRNDIIRIYGARQGWWPRNLGFFLWNGMRQANHVSVCF